MISFAPTEAPTFDDPLEMLHACHGRILSQCDTLTKLAAHLADHGCDQQARQAAHNILRFFDSAGHFHHQDEEENLFPALRTISGEEKQDVENLLERLLADHIGMLAAWDALRPVLLQLSQGVAAPLKAALMQNFINRYSEHIAFEETTLLPLAARVLDQQQKLELGRCMASRRGVGS